MICFKPSGKYTVKSNKESGLGYYDLVIMPKDITQLAIIIELKQVTLPKKTKNSEAVLKKSAKKAVQEIKTNHYHAECQQLRFAKIIYLGIAFSGKNLKMTYEIFT